MTFGDRLKQARIAKGWTQEQLARQIGIAKSTLTGYEKGNREPDVMKIKALAEMLQVSGDYLIGNAETTLLENAWAEPLVAAYAGASRPKQQAVCTVLDIEHILPHADAEPLVSMTIFNYPAAAGVPLYATDDYEQIDFPESQVPSGSSFGIRIQGDSMQPTIANGSIVFVRKQADLQNGQIGIFMIDDDACCKRFFKTNNGCRLESDNPAYSPIMVESGTEGFYIAGKVLGY